MRAKLSKIRSVRAALVAVAFAGLLSGCGTLSVQEEKSLGKQAQSQIRQEITLLRDPVVVNYIRDFGERLVEAAPESPFEMKFYVVEDETLNAFAVPGGAIYVHTGLIQAVGNASELAGVISHEIGHVTLRHVAQSYRKSRNAGVFAFLVRVVVSAVTGVDPMILPSIAAQAYTSTYGKDYERESDHQAVGTMIRAGFNPDALATMFETLQRDAAGGFRMPQFLSSHPASAERIQNTRDEIARRGDLSAKNLVSDDGGRIEIIQQRLEYIVGTDVQEFDEDSEEFVDEEEEEDKEEEEDQE